MNNGTMIEVVNLTKRFAGRTAVSDISFTVGRGEIVGLLGPNGAGKSTTMRILSCFLPATSGTARVAGLDVFRDSQEVRRRIGYMPENNPLHPDMRVREYLKFRARLKGLRRKRSRERVDVVMEQCGLTDVSRRIIGQLSKGYRQRVGLADALVHEPELIILDEPTIGLDPQQIRSVRQLIKSLASSHTVLISTHILPEAEMTCNRMLIMFEGRILAADTPENLQKLMAGNSQVIAEIAAPRGRTARMLVADAGDRAIQRVARRRRLPTVRPDAARGPRFAAADFFAGARTRLGVARTDAQPPFARRHLRAGDETGRGGRVRMRKPSTFNIQPSTSSAQRGVARQSIGCSRLKVHHVPREEADAGVHHTHAARTGGLFRFSHRLRHHRGDDFSGRAEFRGAVGAVWATTPRPCR